MADDTQDREPSSADFARMSKKRYRWVYVAAAGLVAIGAIVFVALRGMEREQQRQIAVSWSEFGACLLGGPLAPGETPASRVRNGQLSIMGVTLDKRAKFGDYSWPASCARYGHAVSETLRGRGKTDGLAESAEKLAKALKDEKNDTADLAAAIDRAWVDAGAMGLKLEPVGQVAPPPPAQSPLSIDTLPASARLLGKTFPLANIRPQMFPHPTLWFVLDQPEGSGAPLLCSATADDPAIRCRSVPEGAAKLGPGLKLWGTTDDGTEPLMFAGDRGSAGIVRASDGAKVADVMTYGAWARADGSSTFLVWNEGEKAVRAAHYPKDGAPSEKKLIDSKDIGNPYYVTGLMWGWLVYEAYDSAADEIRLYARKLPDAGGDPGPLLVAGKVWEQGVIRTYQEEPELMGCRTNKGMAVVVSGRSRDSVSLFADGKWTTPVPSEQAGGTLTCQGLEVATTSVAFSEKMNKYWPIVSQSRCNVSSCTSATVALEDLIPGLVDIAPTDRRQVQAVSVAESLALIWHGGDAGGVRMRFAPIERIRDVADKVLYDDVTEGGKRVLSNLLEMRVIPGEGFSLLLLSTTKGVYVLRVDAAGNVAPAAIKL